MKSLLTRLVSHLSSPLIAVGALASVLCLIAAVSVVVSGLTLAPPTVEDAPRHDGTVALIPAGALEPTPEPLPSISLPPLVLPTKTSAPAAGEPATPDEPDRQVAYGSSPDVDAAALAGDQVPSSAPAKPRTFGEWLRSVFGRGSASSPATASPEASPTSPPPVAQASSPAPVPPAPSQPAPSQPVPAKPAPTRPSPPPTTPPAPAPAPRGAIGALLASLPVQGEDTRQKYKREEFGKGWTNIDGHNCNTRNVILARDLTNVQRAANCKVQSGVLNDPYTGKVINFVAGPDTSDDVQIDHVVALRDAWGTGAQNLDKERRINFSNDPLNLLAVDGPTNNAKGHKNAAAWLPPNAAFHCHYVARQVAVKARYHLWVTAPEKAAMERVLGGCPPDIAVQGDTIVGG